MNRKFFYSTTCMLMLLLLIVKNINLQAEPIMNGINEQDSVIATKELYDIFKKYEGEAVAKYAGKTITLKGFAVFVGPDVYALPSVELSEKKEGKSRILCVLPFSDYLKLRKVSKGDEVIITGEVRGFYEKGDQVLLKQCEIIEVIKNKSK